MYDKQHLGVVRRGRRAAYNRQMGDVTMALPDSVKERAQQGAKVRREVLGAAYVDAG
jgi:hypothetical protein